jgi:DGQHR domain-containing protein
MEHREYFGFFVHQREAAGVVPFFTFYARARDVSKWVGIRRSSEQPEGIQRMLRRSRILAISRFMGSHANNTIPGNILVAFGEGRAEVETLEERIASCIPPDTMQNGCGHLLRPAALRFNFDPAADETSRPALIVDGQHRLKGLEAYGGEDVPILVVGLFSAPLIEQAFQFVVINNKATRVPTSNVKSIIADINESDLERRLLGAGVRYGDKSPILRDLTDLDSSPFAKLLDWDYNREGKIESEAQGKRLVSLTALEQSMRYMSSHFKGVLEGGYEEGDEDSLYQMFTAMWRGVAENYPDIWARNDKMMAKVSLNALNEFLVDRLKKAWEFGLLNIFEPSEVQGQAKKIISDIPRAFWESEWTMVIQDNANVRNIIQGDLSKVVENRRVGRPWNADLTIVVDQEA